MSKEKTPLEILNENKQAAQKHAESIATNSPESKSKAILEEELSTALDSGDFSKIISCVRLNIYINCNADFKDHAEVANGASDLMVEVFGEIGMPTRSTIGVISLPSNSAIEIDAIFAII